MEEIEKTINKYLCNECSKTCEKCMELEVIEYSNYLKYRCLNYAHLSTTDVE